MMFIHIWESRFYHSW